MIRGNRINLVSVLDSYKDPYLEYLRKCLVKELSQIDIVTRPSQGNRLEYEVEFLRKVGFNVGIIAIQSPDADLIFAEPDYFLRINFS